jgi:hypothetical protein
MDLSLTLRPQLRFLANYQHLGADSLAIEASADGGVSWLPLRLWREDHGGFRATPGEAVTVDLAPFAGQSAVVVRWRYRDAETVAGEPWNWYAQLDDVALLCNPTPLCGVGVATQERLLDGGLETGGTWLESSASFPSPVCDSLSCDRSAARSGDRWAFFGGAAGFPETATLEQTVVLYPGAARLEFHL